MRKQGFVLAALLFAASALISCGHDTGLGPSDSFTLSASQTSVAPGVTVTIAAQNASTTPTWSVSPQATLSPAGMTATFVAATGGSYIVTATAAGKSANVTIAVAQPNSFTFTVTDRASGAAVSGAAVTVGGTTITTDGSGRAVFPNGLGGATTLSIAATGYRLRQAKVPTNGAVDLMPIDNGIGMTDVFLDNILFATLDSAGLSTTTINGNVSVYADPEIANDSLAVLNGSIQKAVDYLNAGLQGASSSFVAINSGTSPGAGIPVHILVSPSRANGAWARTFVMRGSGGYIASVEIACNNSECGRDSMGIGHELGHAIGLYHISGSGLMVNTDGLKTVGFTPAEVKAIRILLRTAPGTVLKDDSRNATVVLPLSAFRR